MTIYTCEPKWEAMLSCIYEAMSSRKGHQNIKLLLEPVYEQTLFDEYIHVDSDSVKAKKVMDAVIKRMSMYVYEQLATTAMAYEEDTLDNIYRVMILGFAFGSRVLDMVKYRDVMRNREISYRVNKEAGKFREFIRFHQVNDVYVAHFEPKSRVVPFLGSVFSDRMPSENFLIVDDVHKEVAVHPKDKAYFIWDISDEELEKLKETEHETDGYTDLWKIFFDTIAIKERTNERCQKTFLPLWTRKHMDEFK